MTNNTPVGPGTRVTLLFSIELESGERIDSTEQKPAEFSVGDGSCCQALKMQCLA